MVATLSVKTEPYSTAQVLEMLNAKKTITCDVCSSVFAPAQAHSYLLHSPQHAIEAAFMSMCHFCFRCRRPACPNCWDEVHGLCGVCVEDVHLEFRQEVAALPLNSALLVPVQHASSTHVLPSFPLVCTTAERFQPKEILHEQQERKSSSLQDNVGEQDKHDRQANVISQGKPVLDKEAGEEHHFSQLYAGIERVLTIMLSFVLAMVVVMIATSLLFEPVNVTVVHLFHIDIRMEIRYLFQLLQQLISSV